METWTYQRNGRSKAGDREQLKFFTMRADNASTLIRSSSPEALALYGEVARLAHREFRVGKKLWPFFVFGAPLVAA